MSVLLFASSLFAAPPDCARLLTVAGRAEIPRATLSIGVLAQVAPEKYILGIGDYFLSRHGEIIALIRRKYGYPRLVWRGEFLSRGQIRSRHSGNILLSLGDADSGAGVEELRAAIAYFRPELMDASAEHLRYHGDFPHLDPLLREVRILESAGRDPRDEILRRVYGVLLFAEPGDGVTRDPAREIERWSRLPRATLDLFRGFCESLQASSPVWAASSNLRRVLNDVERLANGRVRTANGFARVAADFREMRRLLDNPPKHRFVILQSLK